MHPIERLRSVARAEGAGPSLLVREAAVGLAGLGLDPMGTVTACRRLVERHPTVGPLWWLAARLMASAEPRAEAREAADAIQADTTPRVLVACLPDDATIVVIGWPELSAEAICRRGDLEVLVIDCAGAGLGLSRRLSSTNVESCLVPDTGLGTAVVEADLVVLEAAALGRDSFVAAAGSRAAAAVAQHCRVPVWVVAGVGRVLPARLWEALLAQVDEAPEEPWESLEEVVPLELADMVVRPEGLEAAADPSRRADCPAVPELLRPVR